MTDVLISHHAQFANFGFTIEQEGDAYSIVFERPGDAVKFCLQAQQLLSTQKWPKGLFRDFQAERQLKKGTSKVARRVMDAGAKVLDMIGGGIGGGRKKSAAGRELMTTESLKETLTQASIRSRSHVILNQQLDRHLAHQACEWIWISLDQSS